MAAPTVTVPGILSNANAPHVSGSATFETYIMQLQNSGRPEDQATANALQQISVALSQIVKALKNDANFTFGVPVAYAAVATSSITLTTTPQAVPGCALTLPTTGQYLIITHVTASAADTTGGSLLSQLNINGSITAASDYGWQATLAGHCAVDRQYVYNAQAGDAIAVYASKQVNAGTVLVSGGANPVTTLVAVWLHAPLVVPNTPTK